LNDIDSDQIKKIQNFRQEVADLGALYWDYNDVDSFDDIIETHLTKVLIDLVSDSKSREKSAPSGGAEVVIGPGVTEENFQDEDTGLLDYLETFQGANVRAIQIMESLTACFVRFSEDIRNAADEMNSHNLSGSVDTKETKRILLEAASSMDRLTKNAEPLFVDLKKETPNIFSAFNGMIQLAAGHDAYKENDWRAAKDGVVFLKIRFEANIEIVQRLVGTMTSLPRLTKDFNASRRRAVNVLERHISDLREFCKIADASVDTLEALASV
jgi:hypothetical protein